MEIKNLIDEDFCQYRKPSMFIGMPHCSFKCDKECGCEVCQNSDLALAPTIDMEKMEIATRFYENSITQAVVFGGLEPFDDFEDMIELIKIMEALYITCFDIKEMPDIVIYTGYYPHEVEDLLLRLQRETTESNIIIKFGRFIPNRLSRECPILGVTLASNNQFSVNLRKIGNMDALKRTGYYYKDFPAEDIQALEEKFGNGGDINENK